MIFYPGFPPDEVKDRFVTILIKNTNIYIYIYIYIHIYIYIQAVASVTDLYGITWIHNRMGRLRTRMRPYSSRNVLYYNNGCRLDSFVRVTRCAGYWTSFL